MNNKKTYQSPTMKVMKVKAHKMLCTSPGNPMTLGNSRQEEVDYNDAGFN